MKALAFQHTQFDIVDRNGQPWLRAGQIAQALDYADESSINRIYARNAGEFTEAMTCTVKLTDQVQEREVRIFSLRGAHLLAMFSRTEVAKEFRRWVLDVLDQEVSRAPATSTLQRWLISFDGSGQQKITPVPQDAVVMTLPQLLEAIPHPGELMVSTDQMYLFAMAALTNLKARLDHKDRLLKQARDAAKR